MSKRIIIPVLFLIIIEALYFSFQCFYLKPVKTETEISFDQQKKLITFDFPYPIPKNYFFKNFKIIPETKGEFVFKKYEPSFSFFNNHPGLKTKLPNLFQEIQFIPDKIERDKTYKVKNFDKEFSFSLPSPKPKEISFDEEEKKIEITFFEPIEEDYFFEKFQLEPSIAGEYTFLNSNTKVIFKPETIEEDKDYKIEILGKDVSFKIESPKVEKLYFDKIKKEIFITFTKPIEEPKFFENFKIRPSLKGNFSFDESRTKVVFKPDKIEEGKNYQVEVLGEKLAFKIEPQKKSESQPQPEPQPQLATGEKFIDINLSEQKLRLYQGGKVTAEYRTSTGKPGMSTPTGDFQVLSKEGNHWSAQYGLYMPYSLRFYDAFYIHELPYWPGGYREGEEHLGIPVSHGCVRVGIGAAENVYNFAEIGTKVVIHK
jgi:lipoprotein-anchoring transpeptidase ErfK/SrfK